MFDKVLDWIIYVFLGIMFAGLILCFLALGSLLWERSECQKSSGLFVEEYTIEDGKGNYYEVEQPVCIKGGEIINE